MIKIDYLEISLKLIVSIILSGIIGIERESIKRPAGFRTHILVCVGSTLVMLVGIYISKDIRYTNVDPTRIGAQVISGIGFLGAGTILKEGVSVKGLTTAASLWAVACVGLAVGAGFYFGAIFVTVLIFVTLLLFSSIESKFLRSDKYSKIRIETFKRPGQLGKIGKVTGDLNLTIVSIDFNNIDDNKSIVTLLLKTNKKTDNIEIINKLAQIENVIKVTHK